MNFPRELKKTHDTKHHSRWSTSERRSESLRRSGNTRGSGIFFPGGENINFTEGELSVGGKIGKEGGDICLIF